MSATSLADALAQCAAAGVDLRVSGKGASACIDLLTPFCPQGVDANTSQQLPRCVAGAGSAQKSAIELKEAEANVKTATPWLLIGGGVVVFGIVAWWVLKN